jgi:hypothetical protein
MKLKENQRFELLKALCYSVPQNPNIDRFYISCAIRNIYNELKSIDV